MTSRHDRLMPGDTLTKAGDMINEMWEYYHAAKEDEELRLNNPAVKEAYEQYQIVKALAKENHKV